MDREKLPDCQGITGDFSSRVKRMAEERANTACGDNRKDKAMYVRLALSDVIHHEAETAYLAGYLQATKDFLLQHKDAALEKP